MKTLGDRIKVARIEHGLLQVEMAQKLSVPAALVGRWERNLKTPTEAQWKKIAALLGIAAEPDSKSPTAE